MASLAFPSMTKNINLRDGTTYGYVRVAATADKPTLLFLHGYPSSSYDWHYQIDHFSRAGYGLVVPDLLGYGDTSKPDALEAYSMRNIGRQIIEVLDHEGLSKVIGFAHDWGCGLQSSMARWHQDRFSAFVFISLGYLAKSLDDIDAINEMTQQQLGYPLFGYWKFHEQADAGALINKHPESYSAIVYPHDDELWKTVLCPIGEIRKWVEQDKRAPRPSWLSEEQAKTHAKILATGGYEPPLKWYKQAMSDASEKEEAGMPEAQRHVHVPVLFIRTEKDCVCLADMNEQNSRPFVQDLRVASLNTGHWAQLEQPDEMNKILEDFVVDLDNMGGGKL